MNSRTPFLLLVSAFTALSGCIVTDGVSIYSTCTHVNECESRADGCYETAVPLTSTTEVVGNTCTIRCDSHAECPRGSTGDRGACLEVADNPYRVCYERCRSDFNCPSGWFCTPTDSGDDICLPG